MRKLLVCLFCLLLSVIACVRTQPEVVVITATFLPPTTEPGQIPQVSPASTLQLSSVPESATVPTANPPRVASAEGASSEYIVQPGDTLTGIAAANGVSVETLLSFNSIPNPDQLSVGQPIRLPGPPSDEASSFKFLPDSRLVRGPDSRTFNIDEFVNQQPGYIHLASDIVQEQILSAAQVIARVSAEYSVDPRLLLALLEYKSHFLSDSNPSDDVKTYPMGVGASVLGFDRNGLYRQLTWTADQLNAGYYGWKYRGLSAMEFSDGVRMLYASGLNAGTVAVQYLFNQLNNNYAAWQFNVSQQGFYQTYYAYFGDPFAGAVEPLVPPDLQQPDLVFPFPSGETWYFTGGPHGGWGTGSAWAAIDFAPPDDLTQVSSACYVSQFWATAVAPGIIARTDKGIAVLDLDGDGDDTTGWVILYLHMASDGKVEAGTRVQIGDRIGHPSCEGGFSTGTHMHIARLYNGEWIPSYCDSCSGEYQTPPLVMNGWTSVGYPNQEYQGYMYKGDERRLAEQGRLTTDNNVSW